MHSPLRHVRLPPRRSTCTVSDEGMSDGSTRVGGTSDGCDCESLSTTLAAGAVVAVRSAAVSAAAAAAAAAVRAATAAWGVALAACGEGVGACATPSSTAASLRALDGWPLGPWPLDGSGAISRAIWPLDGSGAISRAIWPLDGSGAISRAIWCLSSISSSWSHCVPFSFGQKRRSGGARTRARQPVGRWVGGWGTCTHIHMYASSRWVGGAKVGQRWGTPTREYMLLYSLDPHTHSRTYGTCCCTRWIPILTHVRTVTLWPDEQIGADERHERLLPHLHTCMHAPTCIRTHMHAYLRPDEQIGGDERLLHQTT